MVTCGRDSSTRERMAASPYCLYAEAFIRIRSASALNNKRSLVGALSGICETSRRFVATIFADNPPADRLDRPGVRCPDQADLLALGLGALHRLRPEYRGKLYKWLLFSHSESGTVQRIKVCRNTVSLAKNIPAKEIQRNNVTAS